MTTTTETHRTFTETTWKTAAPGGYLNRDSDVGGWTHSHDLAVELAAESALTFEQARVVVSAATTGLPVELTWETTRRDYDRTTIDRTTATVIVRDLGKTMMHLVYWGFGHPVYHSQVVAADAPSAVYDFGREPDAA